MKNFQNKIAVVTGAASGIGRQLAVQLAAKGVHLALADLNADALNETAELLDLPKSSVLLHKLDVADRGAVYEFADTVADKFGVADIVINNAGVSVSQTVEDMQYEDFEWLMNINFWGVVYGTKAFLPLLKQSEEAYIVNISSIFGLISFPTQAAYNASKFAVRGFTEALRMELKDTSILPICVHPGGIKTGIAENARFFATVDGNTSREDMLRLFEKYTFTKPETAAEVIVKGIQKNKRRVLIGADAGIYDILGRYLPNGYDKVLNVFMRALR